MLRAMARSAIHYLKKRGLTDVAIAAQVGCERRTVARVIQEPTDHAYRRRAQPSRLAHWDPTVTAWLDAGLPIKRMLELARADAMAPYTGSPATWYRYVHHHQQARAAAAAPVIRFEGLSGEFLQIDWGEAHVPLGAAVVRRVFLAARLKYSRTVAVRWGTTMVLERLLRGQLAIFEELGGVPWACVYDNMKTVTLGRTVDGQPRWNPTFARFATELGFHPELCDPHAPQQKGSVENLVKFVKTNFLPGRGFADDADLAEQSAGWCAAKNGEVSQAHGERPCARLAAEQTAFGPLRTTAATYGLYRVGGVNRESLVRVDGNQYSVPTGHLGQAIDVRLLADTVVLSRDGVELARHARIAGHGQRQRDPAHYVEALIHRPRARMVLERDALCALGPDVTAYVTAVCQRRRERMAEEIAALVTLRESAGPDVVRQAVTRALARDAIGAEYLPVLAAQHAELVLPTVPTQPLVDRDLASYEPFVRQAGRVR
jgi:transposase